MAVHDDPLSERVQSKANLTLAHAVLMGCQAESRGQNRDLVGKEIKPSQVEFVYPGKTGNDKLPNKETHKPSPSCRWCGRERHNRQSIPPRRVQTTMGGLTAQLGINDRNTRLRLYTGTAVTAIGAHTSWLKIYKALEIFKSQSSAYFKITSHTTRAKSLKRFMSYQTIHVQD